MNVGMHSNAEIACKEPDATDSGQRLMLLFSALTVMTFTRAGLSHTPAALAALAVAALVAFSAPGCVMNLC